MSFPTEDAPVRSDALRGQPNRAIEPTEVSPRVAEPTGASAALAAMRARFETDFAQRMMDARRGGPRPPASVADRPD